MKNFSSVKVAATVLVTFLVIWGGWIGYAEIRLRNYELTPIEPGVVNLVAISPRAGYKIIVANQIAYLAEVDLNSDSGAMEAGSDSVANAPRLPLRELLQTLQGDEEALGTFIERLNKWNETDVNINAPVWRAEDIQLALGGDEALRQQLELDLNVDLRGNPLESINTNAITEGILIDNPVVMDVLVGDKMKTMTGRVQELYQPVFCRSVQRRLNEKLDWTTEFITGIYVEEANKIPNDGGEDVRRSLLGRIDSDRLDSLTVKPKLVLDNTIVLLNETHIDSASYKTYKASKGYEFNDVSLGLTYDGHMRLWKYSHDNIGFQLLFIHNTIAIAAPVIETELAERTVTIPKLPNKDLVEEVVTTLNRIITERT